MEPKAKKMNRVKKIAIYPMLSSGHTNVCVTIAKLLLNKYPQQVEITFVTDQKWKENLSLKDKRFRFITFKSERSEQKDHIAEFMKSLEDITKAPLVQRMGHLWSRFDRERSETLEMDQKAGDILCELKPDLILMDQVVLLPSVVRANCPYAFIVSANPLAFNLSSEYPPIGSDAGVDEAEKISQFRKELEPYEKCLIGMAKDNFEKMKVPIDEDVIPHKPLSKYFSVYCYPKEIDYYSDAVKVANHLISFDTPLIPERITPPFELPSDFAQKQGKIIYVSLGSLFSVYVHLLQRLVDILATLPYRYIVSKGPRGDELVFPNDNFIGENYVNQLAVLQVVDAMIAHGGNNSLTECFFFGVPMMVLPVFVDQINNGKRIEETGYGYQLPIYEYTDDQLRETVQKLVENEEIKSKWKRASERIKKDNTYNAAIEYIFESV